MLLLKHLIFDVHGCCLILVLLQAHWKSVQVEIALLSDKIILDFETFYLTNYVS